MKTCRLLMLLGVALVVLQVFSSSVIPQVRGSGESPNADEGPHTIPTNGGVYDTLTQVQIVTPTTIDAENWTYAYQVRWFMDEAPMDTDGLSLRAVKSTPTNITWQAILQNPPSPGNHSFTFRVLWNKNNNTLLEGVLKWIRGLWMDDFSGSFTITHAYIHYDFDESLNWTVVGGTWSVLNGSLDGFSSAEGLIYTSDIIWEDCMLTAKVKIAADSPRAEAAFCVRVVDSGNFYWAGLGCWGHRVSISRMIDQVSEELVFSGERADIVKDVWYVLCIEVSGDVISLYVNDVLELVINDSAFSSGVVGIRVWNAHVLVDHVTVSCFPSITTPSSKTEREVDYSFACSADDLIYERHTSEHFAKIKQWGFNCIFVPFFWTFDFEQKEDDVGVYNEQNLQGLRRSVDLALSEGLEVILSGRVSFNNEVGWDGWATHDYVNMQDEGLNRYAKFWEMMVQRFPDCMYCLWHFPYHQQGTDLARTSRFYDVTFPTLLSTVRKHSNNKVIFVPIHQSANYYLTANPIDDPNLIYGLGHMLAGKVEYGRNWDYDYKELDNRFAGVKHWRETFNLPMMSVEYAPLSWVRGEPIHQSRLDCLNESLKRMSMYDVGWMYWCLSLTMKGGDNILASIENFKPNTSISTMLQQYSQ